MNKNLVQQLHKTLSNVPQTDIAAAAETTTQTVFNTLHTRHINKSVVKTAVSIVEKRIEADKKLVKAIKSEL